MLHIIHMVSFLLFPQSMRIQHIADLLFSFCIFDLNMPVSENYAYQQPRYEKNVIYRVSPTLF